MAIEHRLHARERATCEAILSYPPLGIVLGRIHDVCLEGISVDTTPITLNLNTPVNVTIKLQTNGRERLCRFPALVVWTQNGRAGLMLRSMDDVASGMLHELGQSHWIATRVEAQSQGRRAIPGA
jgi:hypothetical protein